MEKEMCQAKTFKPIHKIAKVLLQNMIRNNRAQLTLFYIDARNSENCSSKKSSDSQVASSSEC